MLDGGDPDCSPGWITDANGRFTIARVLFGSGDVLIFTGAGEGEEVPFTAGDGARVDVGTVRVDPPPPMSDFPDPVPLDEAVTPSRSSRRSSWFAVVPVLARSGRPCSGQDRGHLVFSPRADRMSRSAALNERFRRWRDDVNASCQPAESDREDRMSSRTYRDRVCLLVAGASTLAALTVAGCESEPAVREAELALEVSPEEEQVIIDEETERTAIELAYDVSEADYVNRTIQSCMALDPSFQLPPGPPMDVLRTAACPPPVAVTGTGSSYKKSFADLYALNQMKSLCKTHCGQVTRCNWMLSAITETDHWIWAGFHSVFYSATCSCPTKK